MGVICFVSAGNKLRSATACISVEFLETVSISWDLGGPRVLHTKDMGAFITGRLKGADSLRPDSWSVILRIDHRKFSWIEAGSHLI